MNNNNTEIPTRELHETIGFCVNCDANRVIDTHGNCINCGSASIYRNGVRLQLEKAKQAYEEKKKKIVSKSLRYNTYAKEWNPNDE
jgi:hypothetical protein